MRWYSHGDPLGGGTSIGEVKRYFDEVVLTYEGDDCLIWPYASTDGGYGLINLDGRMRLVSRTVCEMVNGPPPTPKHEAAHECGNGHLGCVNKRHLTWKTPTENQADRLVHGTHDRGMRNSNSKLTEADVLEIRSLSGVASQSEIARRFGISQQNVSGIISGKHWAWLRSHNEGLVA